MPLFNRNTRNTEIKRWPIHSRATLYIEVRNFEGFYDGKD
ncbi:hypothetical protein EYZ11_008944 [Aspergillus tanneri]|uniref:NERD domain-containing protein n=1 Tax=Aspergillus tanneri TaxID=1220188 RepID=A0A4S3JEP4_9EURO|nr:hypothetical protein EYZ11_008944 [Aspergillus tanneri]